MIYRIGPSLWRVRYDGQSSKQTFTSYRRAEEYLRECLYWGALPETLR